jgi:hypothetical protein
MFALLRLNLLLKKIYLVDSSSPLIPCKHLISKLFDEDLRKRRKNMAILIVYLIQVLKDTFTSILVTRGVFA